MTTPTQTTYAGLDGAYDYFNDRLFAGLLPRCLITMQRKARAYGYFAGGRFGARAGGNVTDEIALNPSHFHRRTVEQSLSTLVHEMVHLWQHHHGKPSRTGYHNAEWARRMLAVGLVPSDTGQPDGKQTGQQMTHYIAPGGPFALACAELLAGGFVISYVELWSEQEGKTRKAKAASKTKYTCAGCGLNAWARPQASLVCGDCGAALEAAQPVVGEVAAA